MRYIRQSFSAFIHDDVVVSVIASAVLGPFIAVLIVLIYLCLPG